MSASLDALLDGLIDYAGLFPPAALALPTAAAQYAEYRDSADRAALGRFVLPAAKLTELRRWLAAHPPTTPWPLSVLVATNADLEQVAAFADDHADIVSVEAKSALPTLNRLPTDVESYVELPIDADAATFDDLRRRGLRAKIRTGGVTTDGFPTPDALLGWLKMAVQSGVTFKATAGLHHPLRADYRLTYDDDAPVGTMFGFLNVFLTAALLSRGVSDDDACRSLVAAEPTALSVGSDELVWLGQRFSIDELRRFRRTVAVSFGSCSFREPLDDLSALGLRPLTAS